MNDTLKINNNIVPIENGQIPLLKPYTGKGVVFGLIDTGVDIDHPDFKDTLGNTRIVRIWDQNQTDNGTSEYGYGIVWDSTSINNGTSTHEDSFIYKGHGTHVLGIGAGNGLAVGKYSGIAPEATIVAVALSFNNPDYILDAVKYIYDVADSLGMPCVINASVGSYTGSHDGKDSRSLFIDSIVNYKPGRAFVCAAGNAGKVPFHLQHQVDADTTFTWFKYNASIPTLGYGAVFFNVWADTADLNNVDFAIGANLPSGTFDFRGRTSFDKIQNRLGFSTDTIKNAGNTIAVVDFNGVPLGDKYLLQVHLQEPDSNAYLFSLMTTGSGKLDVWSKFSLTSTSDMIKTGLPSPGVYPNIIYYKEPDTSQTMVGSYACLPSILTVGSYVNRLTYLDVDSTLQEIVDTVGRIDETSSKGPSRIGLVKPDVAASGRYVMSSMTDTMVNFQIANSGSKWIGLGGKHMLKNGTSMSSPVVAGIAALYLEKCPYATMSEIKNAIVNTSNNDMYTGVTPNNYFGYGKPDGFCCT